MTLKNDVTRPFYAVVGAGDLAVEYARTYATDVQARLSKVDLEPKTLRDQALTVVTTRVEELTKDAKAAQAKLESAVAELQADAKTLPAKVESFTNETVAELTETYGDLAVRGKDLVTRIRNQQSTRDAKAAAKTAVAKAKAAKTQTAKSVKASTGTAKTAAEKTAATAKSSAKATTAAKKTASATDDAVTDAAAKIGD